jgi:hypothetical protein
MSAFRLKLMVMLLATVAAGTGLIAVTACDIPSGADRARDEERIKAAEQKVKEEKEARERAEHQRDTVENSRYRWVVIACSGFVIALVIGTGMRHKVVHDLRRQRAGLAGTEQPRQPDGGA